MKVHNTSCHGFWRLDYSKVTLQLSITLLVVYTFSFFEHSGVSILRRCTVLVHELGHAGAAVATQGKVESIKIASDEGGQCTTEDGSGAAIVFAGYVATMFFGSLALASSSRKNSGLHFSLAFGTLFVLSGFSFSMDEYTYQHLFLLVALCLGTGMLSVMFWPLGSLAMRFLGTFVCVYTIVDVCSDCFAHENSGGYVCDADNFAQMINTHPLIVSSIWLGLAIVLTVASLLYSTRLTAPRMQYVTSRALTVEP